jgi:CheY-like chemotaxis protein
MRILIAEDQDSIRTMIEALVRARGHEVVAVNSGARALDIALTQPLDLILLDHMMPGQYDGIQVCERLRVEGSTRHIPVVMISALADEQSRERALSAGATAYYTKPFSPMALLKEVSRFADRVSLTG